MPTPPKPPKKTAMGRAFGAATSVLGVLPRRAIQGLAGRPPDLADGSGVDPTVLLGLRLRQRLRIEPSFDVAERRAEVRADAAWAAGRPEPVGAVRKMTVPGPAGAIPARLYLPETAPPAAPPLLVFCHGGGWVSGDLDVHDQTCRTLCGAGEMIVLSVDYRLAPEHPYPAATEDALAATAWALANAENLGADPTRVAVGGDSAGGNLAAVTSQQLRDQGEPLPVAQLLIYPVIVRHGYWRSRELFAEGYYLSAADMRWYYQLYAPHVHEDEPGLSPLLHSDLSGLPPAVVVTAECDYLRDEGEAYAAALRAAGVPVTHRRAPGMIHGFVNTTRVRSCRDETIAMAGAIRGAIDLAAAGS